MTQPHDPSWNKPIAPEGPETAAKLRGVLERQPVRAALLLTAANLLIATLVGRATQLFAPHLPASLVALCVLTLITAALVGALGWRREIGLTPPGHWRQLPLLIVPAALVLIAPFLRGVKWLPADTLVYLAVGYALTGLYEELWSRGVILRLLRPGGEVRAALLSAALFGALHLGNLLYRPPAVTLAQMVGAICFGVAYAALRLRTRTLWFLMLLHALHDLTLRLSNFPLIPLDVVQDVILLFYGLFLLRGLPQRRAHDPVAQGLSSLG